MYQATAAEAEEAPSALVVSQVGRNACVFSIPRNQERRRGRNLNRKSMNRFFSCGG